VTIEKMVLLVIVLFSLSACGDGEDLLDNSGLSDATTLSTLDDSLKETLCDSLVEASPAACWQSPNGLVCVPLLGKLSDEVSVCIDTLDALSSEATVAEVKDCFATVDEATCDIENNTACENVIPDNFGYAR